MTEAALVAHLRWMTLRNLTPRTVIARRDAIRRLARHLRCTVDDLRTATPEQLDTFQHEIAHLTARYRADYTGQVRRYYAWLERDGRISTDPSIVLVSIRAVRGLPRPIAEPDLDMALRLVSERVRPWLLLAGYCGLRAAEIANLTRDDVLDRHSQPMLRVLGKGGKERLVPLAPQVLFELLPLPSRGPLFHRRDGLAGHVTPQLVSSVANRALHGIGIPDTLHSLRHRFATRCYSTSHDLRVTQELLGHSSPAVTAVYTQWSRPEATRVVLAVAGALTPPLLKADIG